MSSPAGGISKNSKKIKKSKLSSPSHSSPSNSNSCIRTSESKNSSSRKYKVTKKENKKVILADLTKGLLQLKDYKPELKSSQSNVEISQLLPHTEAERESFNSVLIKVMKIHNSAFEISVKNLTSMRKKIKSWIKNINKPETRGGLVVSPNNLPVFKVELMNILNQMEARCFPTLKSRILEVLKRLHDADQALKANPKEFNPKTCSKHWWFQFQKKHAEFKEKWESLPLERSLNKQNNESHENSEENQSDIEEPLEIESEALTQEYHEIQTPSRFFATDNDIFYESNNMLFDFDFFSNFEGGSIEDGPNINWFPLSP